jgi:hypothetical protein
MCSCVRDANKTRHKVAFLSWHETTRWELEPRNEIQKQDHGVKKQQYDLLATEACILASVSRLRWMRASYRNFCIAPCCVVRTHVV